MRLATLLIVTCAMGVAHGQPARAKDGAALFEEGRELAKLGKFAEACERFATSYELDRAVGTQVNYADCQERLGHLARAWQLFDMAAAQSDREGNAVRAQYARERANVLLPRLATLVITVRHADERMSLSIGGRDYQPAAEIRAYVDPGDVEVVAVTPNQRFAKTVATRAGAESELEIPKLISEAAADGPRKRSWVIAAGLIGVAGLATISISGVMTLSASRQYADAFSQGQCFHTERGAECTEAGLEVVDEARTRADRATYVFIGGLVLVGAATVTYVLAPRQPYEVLPLAGPRAAGLAISGRF